MRDKCPECMSCITATWIGPKRYFFCDFCLVYYDIIDRKIIRVGNIDEVINILNEQAKAQIEQ